MNSIFLDPNNLSTGPKTIPARNSAGRASPNAQDLIPFGPALEIIQVAGLEAAKSAAPALTDTISPARHVRGYPTSPSETDSTHAGMRTRSSSFFEEDIPQEILERREDPFKLLTDYCDRLLEDLLQTSRDGLLSDVELAFFASQEEFKATHAATVSFAESLFKQRYSSFGYEQIVEFFSEIKTDLLEPLPDELIARIRFLRSAKLGQIIWGDNKPQVIAGDLIGMFRIAMEAFQSITSPQGTERENAISQFIAFLATTVVDKYKATNSRFYARLRWCPSEELVRLKVYLRDLYKSIMTPARQGDPQDQRLSVSTRGSVQPSLGLSSASTPLDPSAAAASALRTPQDKTRQNLTYIYRMILSCIEVTELENFTSSAKAVLPQLLADHSWLTNPPPGVPPSFSRTWFGLDGTTYETNPQRNATEALKGYFKLKRDRNLEGTAAADTKETVMALLPDGSLLKLTENLKVLICIDISRTLWKGQSPFKNDKPNPMQCLRICIDCLRSNTKANAVVQEALKTFFWAMKIVSSAENFQLLENKKYDELSREQRIKILDQFDKEIDRFRDFECREGWVRLRFVDLLDMVRSNLNYFIKHEKQQSILDKLNQMSLKLDLATLRPKSV